MDKFSAMLKVSETLKKNGIDANEVLNQEQKDALEDAKFLKKKEVI